VSGLLPMGFACRRASATSRCTARSRR
jgi:hypothetical protein